MKKTIIPVTVLVVFWAKSAWALDMEFYTYGGFDLMVQAFNLIALIFSGIDYKELMTVFAIYGLLGGSIAWIISTMSGRKMIPLLWVGQVLLGAALYFALFVPKGHIAVYDATLNKTQTIGDIPNGIVFVAGCFNKLERAIVAICDTATGPVSSYSGNAGGIGFGMLQNMSNSQDIYATMSMERYMRDCVEFEVIRPGGTIGFAELTDANTNFLDTLAKAVNPAIFTVYYDSANTGGIPVTCTDAWAKLLPLYANPGRYDEALKKTCTSAYINSSDPAELTTCKDIISNTVNYATGTSYTYDTILRQSQLSAMLYHTFMGPPDTSAALQADRRITSSGLGVGSTMNEWIPIIKSILTAIAFGITPFLVLLLPTPFVIKTVTVIMGFFTFLCIWGIVDAAIHMGAVAYASNAFKEIGPDNLGMLAMANMPTLSGKVLAMFGIIRASGLMLAAVIAGMLIRFGGSALAHLAGALARAVTYGGEAGGRMLTPEGRTAEQEELLKAWGSMRVESEERFINRGRALALERERQVEGADNAFLVAGTGDIPTTARMLAGRQSITTDWGSRNAFVGPGGAITRTEDTTQAGSRLTFAGDGTARGSLTGATIMGVNPVQVASTAMQMKISGASHAFLRNNGMERFLSEARQVAGTDATSRTLSDSFNRSFATNFERNIGEGSDFAKHAGWQEQKMLKGLLGAHGGLSVDGNGITAGMDGSLIFTGADGHTFSMKVSESTANALRRAEASAWNEAFNQTASTQEGLAWVSTIAQKVGDTEAYRLLDEARNISRKQQSSGENLTAAFLTDFARNHFDGSTSPEALRRSADYLTSMVANNGAAGQRMVDGWINDFIRRGGYANSISAGEVRQDIDTWGGKATAGMPAGGQEALSRARAETDTVIPEKFQGRGNVSSSWSEKARSVRNSIDEQAGHISQEGHEREATDHFNVKRGGKVLGTIEKRPETEQEALHLSPEFKNEMNRIVQEAERSNQDNRDNR